MRGKYLLPDYIMLISLKADAGAIYYDINMRVFVSGSSGQRHYVAFG